MFSWSEVCSDCVVLLLASAAVLFMEHWKRRQMRLNYIWDLTDYGMEEEVRLPGEIANLSYMMREIYANG